MSGSVGQVLVTGGGGFIGTALTRLLLSQGIKVRNLDFVPNDFTAPGLRHFQGSFLDHGLTREAMAGVDCLFHLAATTFTREANQNPARDAQENILGTLQLLDYACEAGVKRVVFCSSGGTVYGPTDLDLIPETAPTNPISAYGISKLACEKYMRLYDASSGSGVGNGALSTVTLRVANPYGAGQNISKAQGALTTFCHRAVRNEPIEIWGDGTVERDYIDVRDVATALLAAARAVKVSGTEINIGSGRGASLNELVSGITAQLGHAPTVTYRAARSFDVPRNILDIAKAKRALDWEPVIGLRAGIANLLADMQSRPEA
ncbi:NAD-dependent epimerase/dehydratase family protein [Paracoccus sp. CPCC 101403]|uniref:NAD-dependent epimerase/dehydratase family protein n=1 Tax=Paracoccus broussonetiae TaxID=3075834 RepID=A0ABU3ECT2_9RHOB|nr:NAD-dependent epimerase/dehydratase family protein [Paracoccus sp. CPCC 101403]MDT1062036.1 NAD-dependent epimerase/dehydratase family protein [Paracoccus sp. CPCC 101403]